MPRRILGRRSGPSTNSRQAAASRSQSQVRAQNRANPAAPKARTAPRRGLSLAQQARSAKGTPITAAQKATAQRVLTPQGVAQVPQELRPGRVAPKPIPQLAAQAPQQLRAERVAPQAIPQGRAVPAQVGPKAPANMNPQQQLAAMQAKMLGNSNLTPGGQAKRVPATQATPSPMQQPKPIVGATPVQATPQPMMPAVGGPAPGATGRKPQI